MSSGRVDEPGHDDAGQAHEPNERRTTRARIESMRHAGIRWGNLPTMRWPAGGIFTLLLASGACPLLAPLAAQAQPPLTSRASDTAGVSERPFGPLRGNREYFLIY